MQLVSLFYDVEMQSKKHEPMSQEEMVNQVNAFNKALTLWGSAKAIKTWGNWKANSARGNVDPPKSFCLRWKKYSSNLEKIWVSSADLSRAIYFVLI